MRVGDIMATSRERAQGRAAAVVQVVLATVLAASAAHAATALDLYYERATMSAADGACRLFTPDVAGALAAAKAQARGAALRAGATAGELAEIEARANIAGAGCRTPALAAAAERVRAAFEGYARLDQLTFPGDVSTWTAVRPAPGAPDGWRVSQHDRFGWDELVFGLAAHGDARPLMAVAAFADGAQPYGARLVMRDATATDGPYLDVRKADISGKLPLDARIAPRTAARVFTAEAMSPAGADLAPHGAAWAVRFPSAATDALAALDPREAVAVEFLFAGDGPEAVRTAYVEVGDFAAARAFQAMPRPSP